MKLNRLSLILSAVLCSSPSVLIAGPDNTTTEPPAPAVETNVPISQEFTAESSYTGGTKMKQGTATLGNVDSINNHINYVASPQITDGLLLRTGIDYDRNSFGLFSNAPLPNTLQSVNLVLGADMTLSNRILLRVEAHPGIYSDFVNVSGSDFDMPVQFGGTYLWSKDFQIIFGIQVDLKSNYPVIGLPGFRWKFADKWVLSAIPPRPQLQYLVNNSLTLYVGAELLGGTYHLNDSFGNSRGHGPTSGNSNFNGNIVDYTEVRVGAGATWKFMPNMNLDVSGGYVAARDFIIHPDTVGFNQNITTFHNNIGDGAPYAEVGIRGSF